MQHTTKLAILATVLAAGGATAYAATASSENDAQAINHAAISLTQAVAAAEQQHPGAKASRAEFEHSKKSGWVYDVEVVNGAQVFDVQVDAQQGTVVSSVEDKADHERGHDGDRDDD
jgi:uncharacterized membrane protein YkoI